MLGAAQYDSQFRGLGLTDENRAVWAADPGVEVTKLAWEEKMRLGTTGCARNNITCPIPTVWPRLQFLIRIGFCVEFLSGNYSQAVFRFWIIKIVRRLELTEGWT